ncbi:proteinral transcription factor ii-i repeat domain-containing protein 2 [Elysia marginata]|uniref:Proteinral transcription factor ii-i repeat domain-containing protein 2 n=1 Tax=Elysia marginata TaxID=1093978 RepID=A0AAV4EUE4_9GAST|nr:proteinral transcription factor ii-i repeat domain-containing protein 2 [Elysia marginata]
MFKSMSSASNTDFASSVMKAETLMADFIAQNNLSLSVADQLPSLIQSMSPDSTVAKAIRCGKSKTTVVIDEMALCTQQSLFERMKSGPFTISADGSNDMGKTKLQ